MEDNKYYTPKIEEFHVGFEFEMLDSSIESGHNFWSESVFGNLLVNKTGGQYSVSLKDYVEYIKKEEVRVKYLDKGDIEGLGWEQRVSIVFSENSLHNIVFGKKVDYRGEKSSCHLIYNEFSKWLLIAIDKKTIFAGIVQNKSELKKLMEMLQIKS